MGDFVITISRSHGSLGTEIAKALSEKLNVEYYDKAIIKIASEKSGINEALFGKHDEKRASTLFKKRAAKEISSPESSEFLSKDNLFNMQAETIRGIAEKDGSCIIVGRCANHVLGDNPNVVRVFIHSDLEQRIKNVMDTYGITEAEEARRQIEKIDADRANYCKYFTGHHWNDATYYDVCLNTSKLSIEQCVEMICNYIEVKQRVSGANA